VLLSLQKLLQVAGVQVVIPALGPRQSHNTFHDGGVSTIGRLTASVAMDHGSHPFLLETGTSPAYLSVSHSEQSGGRADINGSNHQTGHDLYFALLFGIQGYCPHTSSMRTFSLSSKGGHFR
jgi:hypothetical protein